MSHSLGDILRKRHTEQIKPILEKAREQLSETSQENIEQDAESLAKSWKQLEPYLCRYEWERTLQKLPTKCQDNPQLYIPVESILPSQISSNEKVALREVLDTPHFVKMATDLVADFFQEKYNLYARYETTSSGARIVIKLYP